MSAPRILRRIEGERFSEVVRAWSAEKAVVILGGGPSLSRGQIAAVANAHQDGLLFCIAVNDAYLIAPWADLHYAADAHWHRWHVAGIEKPVLHMSAEEVRFAWENFAGEKCTIENSGGFVTDGRVHVLRNLRFPKHCDGLSMNPRALATGRSSGCQAINLAVLAGARLILLLGFDAREGQPMSHWHGEHPREMPIAAYETFRRGFTAIQPGLEAVGARVINCSPGTAVTAFEKMALGDALALLKVPA